MNKVILMGRLTREPEVRYSQGASQTAVARFTLAVDRRFKREGEPTADFFDCTAFGRQAEFIERYLHKGVRVVVCGSIQNNNYTNRDGQMVYSVRIVVDEVEFAESKSASGTGEGGYAAPTPARTPNTSVNDGFMNIPDGIDEELPFN